MVPVKEILPVIKNKNEIWSICGRGFFSVPAPPSDHAAEHEAWGRRFEQRKRQEALRGLALNPSSRVKVLLILLDVVAATLPLVAQITGLQVGVDVQVVVHAVGVALLLRGRKILLQLLQPVHREEVRLGEDDLQTTINTDYIIILRLCSVRQEFLLNTHRRWHWAWALLPAHLYNEMLYNTD